MKQLNSFKQLIIIHLIAGLFYVVGIIWLVVEVIIYLGSQDPVNLWSIPLIVMGIVIAVINQIRFFNKF